MDRIEAKLEEMKRLLRIMIKEKSGREYEEILAEMAENGDSEKEVVEAAVEMNDPNQGITKAVFEVPILSRKNSDPCIEESQEIHSEAKSISVEEEAMKSVVESDSKSMVVELDVGITELTEVPDEDSMIEMDSGIGQLQEMNSEEKEHMAVSDSPGILLNNLSKDSQNASITLDIVLSNTLSTESRDEVVGVKNLGHVFTAHQVFDQMFRCDQAGHLYEVSAMAEFPFEPGLLSLVCDIMGMRNTTLSIMDTNIEIIQDMLAGYRFNYENTNRKVDSGPSTLGIAEFILRKQEWKPWESFFNVDVQHSSGVGKILRMKDSGWYLFCGSASSLPDLITTSMKQMLGISLHFRYKHLVCGLLRQSPFYPISVWSFDPGILEDLVLPFFIIVKDHCPRISEHKEADTKFSASFSRNLQNITKFQVWPNVVTHGWTNSYQCLHSCLMTIKICSDCESAESDLFRDTDSDKMVVKIQVRQLKRGGRLLASVVSSSGPGELFFLYILTAVTPVFTVTVDGLAFQMIVARSCGSCDYLLGMNISCKLVANHVVVGNGALLIASLLEGVAVSNRMYKGESAQVLHTETEKEFKLLAAVIDVQIVATTVIIVLCLPAMRVSLFRVRSDIIWFLHSVWLIVYHSENAANILVQK